MIGASVGIALCPDDATSRDALVRNADLALYAAKDAGRGVHRFYSSDMHAEAEDRRQLEDDLRTALADGGHFAAGDQGAGGAGRELTANPALPSIRL